MDRRQRRAAQTREKLFRAGLDLFARHGFQATTIKQITDAADVGKGTFFNYFPSKEHIFAALGDLQISKIEATLAELRTSRLPLREILRTFAARMAEEPGRNPLLIRSLMAAQMTSEPVRNIFRERLERGRALLAEMFRLGQERGVIRRDRTPVELAWLVQRSFFGTIVLWTLNPSTPLAQQQVSNFEMLWPALLPAAARRRR
jgi:AcrR family transcriptional regulator